MRPKTYEEKYRRITVALPKTMYLQIKRKLPHSNYGSMSDLVRNLLRTWIETTIIEVKPIEKVVET